MRKRPIEYYNNKIATLKARIKRLIAEKRIAILYERERLIKADKGGHNDRFLVMQKEVRK